MSATETRRLSRGATRKAPVKPVRASKGSVRGVFMGLIKLIGTGVLLMSVWLMFGLANKWLERPVGHVIVEGNFNFLSREKIADLVNQKVSAGFFRMDLEALQISLQNQDWIDTVSISRQWPDVVEVRVLEQQPIARWRDSGFLNQRGELIRVEENHPVLKQLSGLSKLAGPQGQEIQVMSQYQFLSRLLSQEQLKLTELTVSETGRWQMQLNKTLIVELGRDQIDEKIQRLLWLYERRLKQRASELASIDLRYPNAVAVRFKDTADTEDEKNTEDNAAQAA